MAQADAAGPVASEFVVDGGLDIAAAEAYLDALTSDAERRIEAEIAAMRARGEEPAPLDGLVRLGLPLVWASLRREDPGTAEVRFGFQDDAGEEAHAWGEPWPRRGARVSGEALLRQVVVAWPHIARRHLTGEPQAAPAASGDAAGEGSGLPLEVLAADGDGLRLEAGGRVRHFGTESVLVVEVLAGLADLLAGWLDPDDPLARAWADLRAMTDLPPMEIEGDGEGARDPFNEQTAWYARHLGMPVMPYSLGAVSVQARQVLHGARGGAEPGPGEWEPSAADADLDPDAVMTQAAEAADAVGSSVHDFIRGAVEARNMEARQRILYGRGEAAAQPA